MRPLTLVLPVLLFVVVPEAAVGQDRARDMDDCGYDPNVQCRRVRHWTELTEKVVFTPRQIDAYPLSSGELERTLDLQLSPEHRGAGDSVTMSLFLLVDENGVVRRSVILEGSGVRDLDERVASILRSTRFTPARWCAYRHLPEETVAVWKQFRVEWTAAATMLPDAVPLRGVQLSCA
jgi:TonB family protein